MSVIKVNDQYSFEFETVQVDEQGQIAERNQGRAFAFRDPLADEVGLEMVAIPGGQFVMGSPESEHDRGEDESPQHIVILQPFFMEKYPVTQAQWRLANYRGTDAGNVNERLFFSGSYDRGPKGVYRDDRTPVDAFPPNAFGLYDMHGNVSKWCLDNYSGNYEGAAADGSAWIFDYDNYASAGADQGDWITDSDVIYAARGGSLNHFPDRCRSASRHLYSSDSSLIGLGFRVVCEMP